PGRSTPQRRPASDRSLRRTRSRAALENPFLSLVGCVERQCPGAACLADPRTRSRSATGDLPERPTSCRFSPLLGQGRETLPRQGTLPPQQGPRLGRGADGPCVPGPLARCRTVLPVPPGEGRRLGR